MKSLEVAKEAFTVRPCDARNFMQLWDYLKLGIPSMLFILLEWSSYDCQTVIAGYISIED